MAEYIEREAANEALRECVRAYPNSFYNGIEVARSAIIKLRSADVRPVVRGKWEWNEENWWHRCSACGVTFDYDKTYELFDHGFQLANFCPNCGADMREPPKEER